MEAPYFLLNGSGGWENVQLVGGVRRADPYHVRMGPSEHVEYFLQSGPFFFSQEGTNISATVWAAYEHGL